MPAIRQIGFTEIDKCACPKVFMSKVNVGCTWCAVYFFDVLFIMYLKISVGFMYKILA